MENIKTIYLAGGCFWGMQAYFSKLRGVSFTEVAYVNGNTDHTTYYELKATDHAEAIQLKYNPHVISLAEVLLHFFRLIDPTSLNRQGGDVGRQYRTGVYYVTKEDLPVIQQVFAFIAKKYSQKIVVELEELKNYITAEEYHQNYLSKNPTGYCHINLNTLKEPLFSRNFPKPSYEELAQKLSILAYNVTQKAATERPFTSEYTVPGKTRGIFVNVVTAEPLFMTDDQFEAGCGWPSFTKPILTETLSYNSDFLLGYERIEVKSQKDEAHLGHVFPDGPSDKGGLRYCINGAALKFIAYDEMVEQGYGDYQVLFAPASLPEIG